MNEYLVKVLREGRNKKGLKQKFVAEKIGVKGNTLSNYENGVSEPDIDTFCALCDIYDLDPAAILGEAYGLNVQGNNINIKPSEIKSIEKYRQLDTHGKEMVDIVLEKEYIRCISITKDSSASVIPFVNAAHERTDIEVTDEMRRHDDDIMNDPDF